MPINYGDGTSGTYKPLNTVLGGKPFNPDKGYFDMSKLPVDPRATRSIPVQADPASPQLRLLPSQSKNRQRD